MLPWIRQCSAIGLPATVSVPVATSVTEVKTVLANVSFAPSVAQLPASAPGVAAFSCGSALTLLLLLPSLTSLPPHAASASAAAARAMDVHFMRRLLERMTNAEHHAGLAGACCGCRA